MSPLISAAAQAQRDGKIPEWLIQIMPNALTVKHQREWLSKVFIDKKKAATQLWAIDTTTVSYLFTNKFVLFIDLSRGLFHRDKWLFFQLNQGSIHLANVYSILRTCLHAWICGPHSIISWGGYTQIHSNLLFLGLFVFCDVLLTHYIEMTKVLGRS